MNERRALLIAAILFAICDLTPLRVLNALVAPLRRHR